MKSLATVLACTLFLVLLRTPLAARVDIPLEDGHVMHNLVDIFLRYAEAGAKVDPTARAALWDEMLESAYPEFFAVVVYRGFEQEQLQDYKQTLLNQFWNEIYPEMDNLRELDSSAALKIVESRDALRRLFQDFDPQCDYYLTVSFSFNSKAVELGEERALAFGLENFIAQSPELDITMAQEQFHLYHFQFFSPHGGLFRSLWAEGMAAYVSEELVPGYRLSQYLGFTPERMDEIRRRWAELKLLALENLDNSDHDMTRAFMGMEDNELNVPPGAGLYLGEQLVLALVREGRTLQELAHWDAETVHAAMARILPGLCQDQ